MSLVITGNPGVGKHTIAKRLAKEINYNVLDINEIALKFDVYEKNKKTIIVDTKKLAKILKTQISKKTLIVGHLAPYVLSKKQVKKAIILRKNPYKLVSIYKKRKYSKQKILENLGSEVLGIVAFDGIKQFGEKKTFQIDTSSQSISKTLKKIQGILVGKFKEEKIDWLTLVSKRKDLKKFFSY